MVNHARTERALLADLLLRTGPDAPTLCEGWTTRDLAAHLVVRERRPDSAIGMLVPPLAGHGERVRLARAALPYEQLIDQIRNPPAWGPLTNPVTDPLVNTVEFFIHHEDVRRTGDDWAPRELDPELTAIIWRNVKLIGRATLRRKGVGAEVSAPGLPAFRAGSGEPRGRISGDPGELALYFFGREQVARVTAEWPA
ncbi:MULTISPECIES: TIGR03085 family metal-binding protein [Actinoplanes]|uniref:TIGR03085 family metal-binding protein n=1 Tax=Actinoplanes TaxID=1865 RepID=UPI0005F2BEA5|nr:MULTISPECIES: TIGR03085 family metal-binding protein [Actinoplanes]GLY01927.1 TIGR03085 family protein [Actinoplanes sp. NBRC 101535]